MNECPALAVAAIGMILVAAAPRAPERADPPEHIDAAREGWERVLVGYTRDPSQGRHALRALGRDDPALLPPVVLLALADSDLRLGRRRAAARRFEQVLAVGAEDPWNSWAEIGLGSVALTAGDRATARAHYARVVDRRG